MKYKQKLAVVPVLRDLRFSGWGSWGWDIGMLGTVHHILRVMQSTLLDSWRSRHCFPLKHWEHLT